MKSERYWHSKLTLVSCFRYGTRNEVYKIEDIGFQFSDINLRRPSGNSRLLVSEMKATRITLAVL